MQSPVLRRKRQRPIRVLLAAIFIVPLASLIGLWAFAASVTVTSAIREHNFKTENTLYGGSAQGLGMQLGQERLVAYEYLSSGRRMPEQPLLQQFARTSRTVVELMQGVRAGPGMFQPSSWPALTAWENELHAPLDSLRARIEAGKITPLGAFDAYNKIINGQFGVYTTLVAIDNSTLYRQATASINAGRALEMAERETTLITGALAAGGQMSKAAKLELAAAADNKKILMSDALENLPPALGSGYQAILTSAPYKAFESIEDTIISSIGSRGPIRVTPQEFGAAATPLFASYQKAESQDRMALTAEGTRVGNQLLLEVGLAGGLGLLAVVLSVFLMVRFGRRISRELRGLQSAALSLAQERLPDVVSRLGKGEDVDASEQSAVIAPGRILETAKVAEAFSSVQRTAVEAAVGQARLRRGVSQVFRNLAWRSQSLLHRQLALLDTMERRQTEPETLDELFQLDHLTTRMRRHAEGLIILSGSSPGRGWRDPVPVMDVLRAAIAEVEDYKRITVLCDSQDAVTGSAVADVIHLMAELIENAATYSPASTEVTVRAERVANGFAAEVEDRGIGISPEDVAIYNEHLANPPEFDLADSNQLGLFVVARLAAKHGITVTLRRSPFGGTSAIVLLPNTIVAAADRVTAGQPGAFRGELSPGGSPALPGPFPGLSLVGSERADQNGTDPGGGSNGSGPAPSGWQGLGPETTGPAENGWAGVRPERPVAEVLQAEAAPPDPPLPSVPTTGVPVTGVTATGVPLAGAPTAGSLPWPPAEPAPDPGGYGGRHVSPWFETRRQVISADAQSAEAPPLPYRRMTPSGRPEFSPPPSAWATGAAGSSAGAPMAQAPTTADAARQALPRRQRQASLAPQLRESGPASIEEPHDGADGPSPDGSRALVESLQYGLDRARATPAGQDDSWPAGGEAWPSDPWQATDSWPAGSWAPPRPDVTATAEDAEGQ